MLASEKESACVRCVSDMNQSGPSGEHGRLERM